MPRTVALFVVPALAEVVGCYLPFLWLRRGGSPWLPVPAAASLVAFAWLLSLHTLARRGLTLPALEDIGLPGR